MTTVYERLGVRRLINAVGNKTTLGGSLMEAETLQAMTEAAQWFVDLNDLLKKAGQHIAGLIGVEGAFITSGAAAGLTVATAACVTRGDPAKIARLPDTQSMKNEVVIHRCQRNIWEPALRAVGATLVEIGRDDSTDPDDLERAINANTAAVVFFVRHHDESALPLPEVIRIAHVRSVPVIVDSAAEIPPVSNLRRLVDMGADLVVFSGGKMIRGPQSTGLVLGRKEFIEACALNANPNFGIGRPLKVGKEEIVGLVTAVERFVRHDFEEDMERWERQIAHCLSVMLGLDGVQARRVCPGEDDVLPSSVPRIYITWDAQAYSITPEQARQLLLDGEPSIAVHLYDEVLAINPTVLMEGEEQIVASRLAEVIRLHRRQ